jgi:putative insertion element HTH domain-containing protein
MATTLPDDADVGFDDSRDNQKELSARQVNAAALLASGSNKAEVCRQCKLSTQTLYNWLKLQQFKDKVKELRDAIVDCAIGRLAVMMSEKCLDKLLERLDRVDEETGQTLATVEDIRLAYDLYGGLRSNVELAAKLDKLMERLGEAK